MISIGEYLDSEGFLQRSNEQVIASLRRGDDPRAYDWLSSLINHFDLGFIPEDDFYTEISKRFGESCFYDLLKSRFRDLTEAFLEKLVSIGLNGKRILDVGCGTGLEDIYLSYAVGDRGRVVGIDKNQGMLRYAIERARKRKCENLDFLLGNREELAFSDCSFDLAFSYHSLSSDKEFFGNLSEIRYYDAIEKRMKEMARVLVPGGKIVVVKNPFEGDAEYELDIYSKMLEKDLIEVVDREVLRPVFDRDDPRAFICGRKAA